MSRTKRIQRFRTLREWRAAQEFGQREAAQHLQVSQSCYAKIEIGVRHPRPKLAARLMQATGVSLESLLGIG